MCIRDRVQAGGVAAALLVRPGHRVDHGQHVVDVGTSAGPFQQAGADVPDPVVALGQAGGAGQQLDGDEAAHRRGVHGDRPQPVAQRRAGIGMAEQRLAAGAQGVDVLADDRDQQRLRRREVPVQRAGADTGLLGDAVQRRGGAVVGELGAGGGQHPVAVALRVAPHRSPSSCAVAARSHRRLAHSPRAVADRLALRLVPFPTGSPFGSGRCRPARLRLVTSRTGSPFTSGRWRPARHSPGVVANRRGSPYATGQQAERFSAWRSRCGSES